MFDTMTATKVVGGLCGALAIFLVGNFVAGLLIHSKSYEAQAYVIEIEETAGADGEAGPSFEELYAAADPTRGATLFRNCRSCHSVEAGVNSTGPTLHGVVGRAVDVVPGFSYSGALEKVVDVWTPENIDHFIKAPRAWVPGTAMTYAGLKKGQDRADLIAYLATLQ